MMTEQLRLFPLPQAKARISDPVTSYEAADSVGHIKATQQRVLSLLRLFGPMSDEQIAEQWTRENCPRVSPSGLRTRRSELVALGLVADSGDKVTMTSGRRAIVWTVTERALSL